MHKLHLSRRLNTVKFPNPLTRHLAFETLEDRRMLFVPYGGGAVWGLTDLTFSYSNLLDGSWVSGLSNSQLTQAAEEAMGVWASISQLTFTQTGDSGPLPTATDDLYPAGIGDPLIRWGHHLLDGPPVPMMTNTVAHGFRPGADGRNGDIHFDNGDTFTITNFLETATHEIGHTLGLDHANGDVADYDMDGTPECPPQFAAIMHACIGGGIKPDGFINWAYSGLGSAYLLQDDINGIQSLYNAGLGYVLNSTGQLSVYGTLQADIFSVHYEFGTGMLTVTNGGNSFTRSLSGVTQIVINANAGDDVIFVDAMPSNIITVVNGGAGNDSLTIRGSSGDDTLRLVNGSLATNNNSSILFNSINSVALTGIAGADVLEVVLLPANLPVTINGGDQNDQIYLANGGSTNAILSTVTINGGNGDDTIYLATNTPGALSVINSPVIVNGDAGNDTLQLSSDNVDSIDTNVTFNGGASVGAVGDRIFFNDTAPSYNVKYDIASTFVSRDGFNLPHTVSYSSAESIIVNAGSGADTLTVRSGITATLTLNGNGGNDNFIVGDGNLTGFQPQGFIGGDGADTITFDDHSDFTARIWDLRPDEVLFGGLIPLATVSFESVAILGGINGDEFTFAGNFFQTLYVDGSLGSDTFQFGFNNNRAQFFAPVTVLGDVGNDVYIWQYGSNNWYSGLFGTSTYPVSIDGGVGFNSLSIDETTRTTANYQLYDNRFYAVDPAAFAFGADFQYDNMGAIGITLSNSANNVAVYGISSDIAVGQQVTLLLNGGNDQVSMYPRDAGGNLTMNGNFGIGGGSGTDTLNIQDAASADAIHYSFFNQFGPGTTNIGGLGAGGFGAGSDFESIVVNAGAGADTFDVNQYASGTALTLNSGAGDDTLNFGGGNLPANITSIAALTFNGQDDFDTFNLKNSAYSTGFTYRRNNGTMSATSGAYVLNISESSTERVFFDSGNGADVYRITAVAAGTQLDISAGAGIDALLLGDLSFSVSEIFGPITFDTGADAGRVSVTDINSTIGKVAHLDTNSLGAYPGDTLFGTGGSLHFTTLVNQLAGINFNAMGMSLGSGADTIYAQPLATGTVGIFGSNPTAAPGDTHNLSLVTAANYVINGTPASGNVTSTNLKTLSYTGFETGPNILSAEFDGDGDVDGRDFLVWQRGYGKPNAMSADGDANNDMLVNGADLGVWQLQYGVVPPPLATITDLGLIVSDVDGVDGLSDVGPQLSAVGTQPLLSSELVDLAMAMNLMNSEQFAVEKSAFYQSTTSETVLDSVFALNDLLPVARSSTVFDFTAMHSDNMGSSDEPWLTDAQLQKVFG